MDNYYYYGTLERCIADLKNARAEKDLVVAHKNGKCALFNTANSEFLTRHEFDGIKISNDKHHIVYKADDLIDERGNVFKNKGDITYSAVVDNNGKVKEFENLVFGKYGETFVDDVCPAYNTKTKKVHLINYVEGIISDGFDRIKPVSIKENYGLYFGLDKNKKGAKSGSNYNFKALIYKDGSIVPLTLNNDSESWQNCKIDKLADTKNLVQMIGKFGANILELTPVKAFDNLETYLEVIKAVNQNFPNQFLYTIEFLSHKFDESDLAVSDKIKLDISVNGENEISASVNKKILEMFLEKLESNIHLRPLSFKITHFI